MTQQTPIPTGALDTNPTIVVEIVRAIVIIAGTFGIAINAGVETQLVAIGGAVLVIVSAALAWYNRSKVYAPASVQKIANNAAATQSTDIGTPPSGNAG